MTPVDQVPWAKRSSSLTQAHRGPGGRRAAAPAGRPARRRPPGPRRDRGRRAPERVPRRRPGRGADLEPRRLGLPAALRALRRTRVHRQGGALGRRAGYARRLKLALVLAVVFMVFAAAGLSSLEGNDFCNTNRASATQTSLAFWPPGRECVDQGLARARPSRDGGDARRLLRDPRRRPAAASALRRSHSLAVADRVDVRRRRADRPRRSAVVPAFGFGWMIGGIIGFHFTRSIPSTLTAAGALRRGGVLQIVGAGPGAGRPCCSRCSPCRSRTNER